MTNLVTLIETAEASLVVVQTQLTKLENEKLTEDLSKRLKTLLEKQIIASKTLYGHKVKLFEELLGPAFLLPNPIYDWGPCRVRVVSPTHIQEERRRGPAPGCVYGTYTALQFVERDQNHPWHTLCTDIIFHIKGHLERTPAADVGLTRKVEEVVDKFKAIGKSLQVE